MSSMNVAETHSEAESQALTDGFHLVIDALKLNDINTIYGVPGIPITDLGLAKIGNGLSLIHI